MKKKKFKKAACKIARAHCGTELVHGMPHINRMLKNFKLLKSVDKSGKEILDTLEFIIILHDIGRINGEEEHGAKSVKILKQKENNFFPQIPKEKRMLIEHAIFWHKPSKDKKPYKFPNNLKKSKDISLALLFALDNIDAIGKIGVHRDFEGMKDKLKWFPDKNKKDESFLERLLKNYCHIDGNISRIKKIKSKIKTRVLLELYEKLKKQQEEYICKLIKEKKLRIKKSEISKVLTSDNFCN